MSGLNEYHRQFLGVLAKHRVRFLVIGGQARRLYHDRPSRDLDIWVDISTANMRPLTQALVEWKAQYPSHTLQPLTPPLDFRPRVQIKFPDADCLFLNARSEPEGITPDDGIDVLTSIRDYEFAEFYGRARSYEIDGAPVAFLSEADIETISPRTKENHSPAPGLIVK